jgi:hypothetical protein
MPRKKPGGSRGKFPKRFDFLGKVDPNLTNFPAPVGLLTFPPRVRPNPPDEKRGKIFFPLMEGMDA